MSYSEINNQEPYYENLAYENMNNNLTMDNEEDDLFYEAELVPFNDTHDCLRLLKSSEFDDYYDPVVANSKSFDSYNENIMERIQRKLHLNTNELKVLYQFLLDVNLTTTEGCTSSSLSSATQDDCSLPDLNVPHLRPFFKPIYTLVLTIVLYSILILIGVTGNSTVYLAIVRKRLHQGSNTQACVLNANLAFLIQLIIVVPLSVFNLVVQNWILGPFLCYILPMLQDVPSFNLMLTLFLLSYDRLRALKYPVKPKIPIRWALCIIWFLSIAFVLPYYAHIKYLELSQLQDIVYPSFGNGQMCIVNVTTTNTVYKAILLGIGYIAPVVASIVFLIQTSSELKIRERTSFSTTLDRDQDIEKDIVPTKSLNLHSSKQTRRGQQKTSLRETSSDRRELGSNGSHFEGQTVSTDRSRSICQYGDDNSVFLDLPKERYMSTGSTHTTKLSQSNYSEDFSSKPYPITNAILDLRNDETPMNTRSFSTEEPILITELDIAKEKRAQKFLFLIVLVHVICLLPLNVLKVVRQMVAETYDNDDYYDVTFVVIVFISFLPSVFMPWFFVHWILIGQIKTKGMTNILFDSSKPKMNVHNVGSSKNGMNHQQQTIRVQGEKRKPSSESFSLDNREGSVRRQSRHSRHQHEARHTMMLNSEGSKYTNASMNTENCTCNMYAPRLSNTSQELLKPVKRDACTSPTIPSTDNLTYATRKGGRRAKDVQLEHGDVVQGCYRADPLIISKSSVPSCCVADVHTTHRQ